jgi:hypothetical protein
MALGLEVGIEIESARNVLHPDFDGAYRFPVVQ